MCAWKHGLNYAQQKDALSADGCPICTLLVTGMRKYLFWFLYESVNDAHIRKRLLESKGFCREHAWQLYQIEREEWSDSLDAALLYEDGIKDAMRALDGLKWAMPSFKPKRWLFRNLSHPPLSPFIPKKECPACEHQRQLEWIILGSLS